MQNVNLNNLLIMCYLFNILCFFSYAEILLHGYELKTLNTE